MTNDRKGSMLDTRVFAPEAAELLSAASGPDGPRITVRWVRRHFRRGQRKFLHHGRRMYWWRFEIEDAIRTGQLT